MADQTRRDILQTARQLFARQGYAATSVTDIAGEAGVAVQTIYARLGSKRGMLMALIDLIDEEADVGGLAAGIRAASRSRAGPRRRDPPHPRLPGALRGHHRGPVRRRGGRAGPGRGRRRRTAPPPRRSPARRGPHHRARRPPREPRPRAGRRADRHRHHPRGMARAPSTPTGCPGTTPRRCSATRSAGPCSQIAPPDQTSKHKPRPPRPGPSGGGVGAKPGPATTSSAALHAPKCRCTSGHETLAGGPGPGGCSSSCSAVEVDYLVTRRI